MYKVNLNPAFKAPAKTCVCIARTKHYYLHFNKRTGNFFYKGEVMTPEACVKRWGHRQDNHAILFSAVVATLFPSCCM